MGKYDDFNKPAKPEGNYQQLVGLYGCQSCEENVNVAWFDEQQGQIFWFCSQEHRSEINVGV